MGKYSFKNLGQAFDNTLFLLTILAAVFLVFVVGGNIISQAAFYFCDHPHDFFIPLTSGYAFKNGYTIHNDLHTPFSWIYHAINAAGLYIIESFPDLLSLNNFLTITSLIVAFAGSVLFIATTHTFKLKEHTTILLILLVALSTIFQFKSRMDRSALMLAPALRSIYNNQLWGLAILQLGLALLFMKALNTGLIKNRWQIIVIGIVQALFLYINFHYKVSFFVGAALIAASVIFLFNLRQAITYIATGFTATTLLIAVTYLSGYSYEGYFADLQSALLAKATLNHAYSVNYEDLKQYNSGLLVFKPYHLLLPLFISAITWIYYYFYRKQNASSLSLIRVGAFMSFIIFALYADLKGDYDKPITYMIIAASLFALINPVRKFLFLKYTISLTLLFFVLVNILSISVTTSATNNSVKGLDFQNFSIKAINSPHKLNFIIIDRISGEDKYKARLSEDPVFDTIKPLTPHFSIYVKQVFQNEDYSEILNEIMSFLEPLRISRNEKLYFYEFTNPLPFLTNSSIPANSLNWQHVGITISPDKLDNLNAAIADSDTIIIPRISGNSNAQQLMNCNFYRWNFANNEKFKVYKTSRNAVYLGTEEFIKKHSLHEVYKLDNIRKTLEDTCEKTRENFSDYYWSYPS